MLYLNSVPGLTAPRGNSSAKAPKPGDPMGADRIVGGRAGNDAGMTKHPENPRPLVFRKSSYSANASDCVEVADTPTMHAVQDTKNRDQVRLEFASPEWCAFIDNLKAPRG